MNSDLDALDEASLPRPFRARLEALRQELVEGEINKSSYDRRRQLILQEYSNVSNPSTVSVITAMSPVMSNNSSNNSNGASPAAPVAPARRQFARGDSSKFARSATSPHQTTAKIMDQPNLPRLNTGAGGSGSGVSGSASTSSPLTGVGSSGGGGGGSSGSQLTYDLSQYDSQGADFDRFLGGHSGGPTASSPASVPGAGGDSFGLSFGSISGSSEIGGSGADRGTAYGLPSLTRSDTHDSMSTSYTASIYRKPGMDYDGMFDGEEDADENYAQLLASGRFSQFVPSMMDQSQTSSVAGDRPSRMNDGSSSMAGTGRAGDTNTIYNKLTYALGGTTGDTSTIYGGHDISALANMSMTSLSRASVGYALGESSAGVSTAVNAAAAEWPADLDGSRNGQAGKPGTSSKDATDMVMFGDILNAPPPLLQPIDHSLSMDTSYSGDAQSPAAPPSHSGRTITPGVASGFGSGETPIPRPRKLLAGDSEGGIGGRSVSRASRRSVYSTYGTPLGDRYAGDTTSILGDSQQQSQSYSAMTRAGVPLPRTKSTASRRPQLNPVHQTASNASSTTSAGTAGAPSALSQSSTGGGGGGGSQPGRAAGVFDDVLAATPSLQPLPGVSAADSLDSSSEYGNDINQRIPTNEFDALSMGGNSSQNARRVSNAPPPRTSSTRMMNKATAPPAGYDAYDTQGGGSSYGSSLPDAQPQSVVGASAPLAERFPMLFGGGDSMGLFGEEDLSGLGTGANKQQQQQQPQQQPVSKRTTKQTDQLLHPSMSGDDGILRSPNMNDPPLGKLMENEQLLSDRTNVEQPLPRTVTMRGSNNTNKASPANMNNNYADEYQPDLDLQPHQQHQQQTPTATTAANVSTGVPSMYRQSEWFSDALTEPSIRGGMDDHAHISAPPPLPAFSAIQQQQQKQQQQEAQRAASTPQAAAAAAAAAHSSEPTVPTSPRLAGPASPSMDQQSTASPSTQAAAAAAAAGGTGILSSLKNMFGGKQQQATSQQQLDQQQQQQMTPDMQAQSANDMNGNGSNAMLEPPLYSSLSRPRAIPDTAVGEQLRFIMSSFSHLGAVLRHRAATTPKAPAFVCVDSKLRETGAWSWSKTLSKTERVIGLLKNRNIIQRGERVALVYRKYEILDFIAAFFACASLGLVAVPVLANDSFAEMTHVLTRTQSRIVLTTDLNVKALSKDIHRLGDSWPSNIEWVKTNDLNSFNSGNLNRLSLNSNSLVGETMASLSPHDLAYIEYAKSPTGELKGVQITHGAIMTQCLELAVALGIAGTEGYSPSPHHQQSPPSSPGTRIRQSLEAVRRIPSLGRLRGSREDLSGGGNMRDSYHGGGHSHSLSNGNNNSGNNSGRNSMIMASDTTVMVHVDPRQHIGLIMGPLMGVFGGHRTVFLSGVALEQQGAWVSTVSRYRATMCVLDNIGLEHVANHTPSLAQGQTTSELSSLRTMLIDTFYPDLMMQTRVSRHVLAPRGCNYGQILNDTGSPVIMPVCILCEHGSLLFSMREVATARYGGAAQRAGPNETFTFGLDRAALLHGRIHVVGEQSPVVEIENGEHLLAGGISLNEEEESNVMWTPTFGFPSLQATVAIVDPETKILCNPDSIGEIWVDSPCLGSGFWALPKLTHSIFSAFYRFDPNNNNELVTDEQPFLRTGLMGALIRGQIVIFGFYEDRIRQYIRDPVSGARDVAVHYTHSLVSSVLRRMTDVSECVIFELVINDAFLPVIVVEPNEHVSLSDAALPSLADRVYHLMRRIHSLDCFAVVVCKSGAIPRAFQYGRRTVNAHLCRARFEAGELKCLYLRMSVDRIDLGIPDIHDEDESLDDQLISQDASIAMFGRWLQHTSLELSHDAFDERTMTKIGDMKTIVDLLAFRSFASPDDMAYMSFDAKGKVRSQITLKKFNMRVSAIAQYIGQKKGLGFGDHAIVCMPPGVDFVATIHACFAIGVTPIPLSFPEGPRYAEQISTIIMTAADLRVTAILVTEVSEEALKPKTVMPYMRVRPQLPQLPRMININKAPAKPNKMIGQDGWLRSDQRMHSSTFNALILVYMPPDAPPYFVRFSHEAIMAHAQQQKSDLQMSHANPLLACVRTVNGYGFFQSTIMGVYNGCSTIFIHPADFHANPQVWFEIVNKYRIKDAYLTQMMLEHTMYYLRNIDYRNFSLHAVKNMTVATEDRPTPDAYRAILSFFLANRLEDTSVNNLYGHFMNPIVSTRAYLGIKPLTIRLDLHMLRKGKVATIPAQAGGTNGEDEAEEQLCLRLQDSGKVSSNTMVAIVNPVTRRVCTAGEIGEIWVYSKSNAHGIGFFGAQSGAADATSDMIGQIDGGNPEYHYVRTGDLGFLYLNVTPQMRETGVPEEPYLFVLGRMSDTFDVNGFTYFLIDVEQTAEASHEHLMSSGCVVFKTKTNQVVVAASLRFSDPAKCNMFNAAACIVQGILEEHRIMVDEVVFIRRGSVPKTREQEKKRQNIVNMYESGTLPIVARFPTFKGTSHY
ncbi:acetyl-CoA synthetase-like protein [Ramicandelaber brevisporus]|nr:acetyl-CoA synthetase-like protein [Ramicandelaber brevisporus]